MLRYWWDGNRCIVFLLHTYTCFPSSEECSDLFSTRVLVFHGSYSSLVVLCCSLYVITNEAFLIHSVFSSPPQRLLTSDFDGFLYQILSIILFSYLNSWERASINPFWCWVLNKGTTGTILKRLWYDAVIDWGLNPGAPTLKASTLPLGWGGGYPTVKVVFLDKVISFESLLTHHLSLTLRWLIHLQLKSNTSLCVPLICKWQQNSFFERQKKINSICYFL